jgi:hypothetical protein
MHCTGAVGPHEPAVLLTVVKARVYPRISYRRQARQMVARFGLLTEGNITKISFARLQEVLV